MVLAPNHKAINGRDVRSGSGISWCSFSMDGAENEQTESRSCGAAAPDARPSSRVSPNVLQAKGNGDSSVTIKLSRKRTFESKRCHLPEAMLMQTREKGLLASRPEQTAGAQQQRLKASESPDAIPWGSSVASLLQLPQFAQQYLHQQNRSGSV